LDRLRGRPWLVRHSPTHRAFEGVRGTVQSLPFLASQDVPAERAVRTSAGAVATHCRGARGVIITRFLAGRYPRREVCSTACVPGRTVYHLDGIQALCKLPASHSDDLHRGQRPLSHVVRDRGTWPGYTKKSRL
jgi:hypothetical protein